ncbi:LuxR C-terminal-related transcriptional regulator [Streptomyces sp. NPDC058459]|uniref:helix-turn-helix transcriptional regulator n=1 Tax=Streptomyces sp. NPDC058459 TaxID=3346508 RepID=UPI0036678593
MNSYSARKSVRTVVYAEDRLTGEGAVAALASNAQIELLPAAEVRRADMFLVIAREVSEKTLCGIEESVAKNPALQTIIVADVMSEPRLIRAVALGVVSILIRKEVDYPRIADSVVAAISGEAEIPPEMLGKLVRHMRRVESVRPSGGGLGLTARDLRVLALLADGLDTTQIAQQLNYSERTIKGIIHETIQVLGVGNRTHAVAYALRAGLL